VARNFGISPRVLPRNSAPGANAGASFFTWKAAAKRLYYGLCKGDRASAQTVPVRIVAEYMGRQFFAHGFNNCTQTLSPSHPVEVKS
jgi:hypothetical protein